MTDQQLAQIERAAVRLDAEGRNVTVHSIACALNLSHGYIARGITELTEAGRWRWSPRGQADAEGENADPPITPAEFDRRRAAVLITRGLPVTPYDHARGA